MRIYYGYWTLLYGRYLLVVHNIETSGKCDRFGIRFCRKTRRPSSSGFPRVDPGRAVSPVNLAQQ